MGRAWGKEREEWEWDPRPDSAAGRRAVAAPGYHPLQEREAGLAPPKRRTRQAAAALPRVRLVMEAPQARRGLRALLDAFPVRTAPPGGTWGPGLGPGQDEGWWRSPGSCREAAHLPRA